MATAAATETARPHEEARKRPYVVVFAVLAVVTLAELNVYSLGIPHLETITILVVLATIKASLVVAYYMHLRYEPRWIALIPLGGLALVAVLVAALTATSVHPLRGRGSPGAARPVRENDGLDRIRTGDVRGMIA